MRGDNTNVYRQALRENRRSPVRLPKVQSNIPAVGISAETMGPNTERRTGPAVSYSLKMPEGTGGVDTGLKLVSLISINSRLALAK